MLFTAGNEITDPAALLDNYQATMKHKSNPSIEKINSMTETSKAQSSRRIRQYF
jgi:hypothetical protein